MRHASDHFEVLVVCDEVAFPEISVQGGDRGIVFGFCDVFSKFC